MSKEAMSEKHAGRTAVALTILAFLFGTRIGWVVVLMLLVGIISIPPVLVAAIADSNSNMPEHVLIHELEDVTISDGSGQCYTVVNRDGRPEFEITFCPPK